MLSYLLENSCHVTKLPAVQNYYIKTTEISDVDNDQNGFDDFFRHRVKNCNYYAFLNRALHEPARPYVLQFYEIGPWSILYEKIDTNRLLGSHVSS